MFVFFSYFRKNGFKYRKNFQLRPFDEMFPQELQMP